MLPGSVVSACFSTRHLTTSACPKSLAYCKAVFYNIQDGKYSKKFHFTKYPQALEFPFQWKLQPSSTSTFLHKVRTTLGLTIISSIVKPGQFLSVTNCWASYKITGLDWNRLAYNLSHYCPPRYAITKKKTLPGRFHLYVQLHSLHM